MADLDFTNRNAFRKGSKVRMIDEDPTYLSFMFLFHYNDHSSVGHSPLLDGTAEKYLRSVVRDDVGETYANNLKNFTRVLRKVNTDMPWFWQSLKGLELALNYGDMKEPWRGAEKPQLEIECLEENIELTAIGLMDLYKRSCFDFERYVEVVPRNLREFSMDVIVSEVRVFQKDTNARNLGLTDNEDSIFDNNKGGTVTDLHQPSTGGATGDDSKQVVPNQGRNNLTNKDFGSADVTPFIRLRFTHCEFDMNSIADYFAEMKKNPEVARPVIKINWGTCRQIDQKLGQNLFDEKTDSDKPINKRIEDAQKIGRLENAAGQTTGQKYLNALRGRTTDRFKKVYEDTRDAAKAQANSIANSFANPDQPGIVKNLIDKGVDDVTGSLLLGNVHGLGGTINDISTAIKTGSLNAIGNLVGNLVGSNNSGEGGAAIGGLGNVGGIGIDSSGDNTDLGKIYDEINDGLNQPEVALGEDNIHGDFPPPNQSALGKERIHPQGVDSSPDGNLNENVHE